MYTNLKIENFKSVKSLDLPLKRVNVLIGEPNTGKSNILEACALMGTGYACDFDSYVKTIIRHKHIKELFHRQHFKDRKIEIELGEPSMKDYWAKCTIGYDNVSRTGSVEIGSKLLVNLSHEADRTEFQFIEFKIEDDSLVFVKNTNGENITPFTKISYTKFIIYLSYL